MLKDQAVIARVSKKRDALKKLRREFVEVEKALVTLKQTPDDTAANATVGVFFCLIKGDWENGLPHLVKGTDQTLAEAAKLELVEMKMARDESFVASIAELADLARTSATAIMCSEEDPAKCHRLLLIAPALAARGVDSLHIRKSGDVASHLPINA